MAGGHGHERPLANSVKLRLRGVLFRRVALPGKELLNGVSQRMVGDESAVVKRLVRERRGVRRVLLEPFFDSLLVE